MTKTYPTNKLISNLDGNGLNNKWNNIGIVTKSFLKKSSKVNEAKLER